MEQLNTIQQMMQPSDFQLCTAYLRPAESFGSPSLEKGVGTITLSHVVFNATRPSRAREQEEGTWIA